MNSSRKESMSELSLHRSVAEFMDWMVLPPALWTTFPSGWTAMRTGAAGRLKACGLKAGMPDILVFHAGKTIGIELKAPLCSPSPIQIDMFNKLKLAGITVHVARSIETVHSILLGYQIPMRKFSHAQSFETPEGRRAKEPAQSASRAAT